MGTVAELIAQNITNVLENSQTWGDLVYTIEYDSTAADHTSAIQAAIEAAYAGGGGIVLINDHYKITGTNTLTLRSNVTLQGTPSGIIDFSDRTGFVDSDNPLMKGYGTLGSEVVLSENTIKGGQTFSFTTTGFSADDLVFISSDLEWPGDTTPGKAGELQIIESIDSASQISTVNASFDNYLTTDSAKLQKITPIENVSLIGLTFIGQGVSQTQRGDYGIVFRHGKNITVRDCRFEKIDQCALDLQNIYGFTVDNNYFLFDDSPGIYVQYGIKFSNASCFGNISKNTVVNSRHAIVAGFTSEFEGVQRMVSITENNISGCWHAAISTHNAIEHIVIANNKISGCVFGVNLRDKNVDVIGNELINNGQGIYLSTKPYNIKIHANRIINGAGSSTSAVVLNASQIFAGHETEYIEITDNYMENGGIVLEVNNTAILKRGYKVEGNTIKNATSSALSIVGRIKGSVSNNNIYKAGSRGIRLQGPSYCKIVGNEVEDTVSASIQLEDVTISTVVYPANYNVVLSNIMVDHDYVTAFYNTSTGANNQIGTNYDLGASAIT